MKKSFVRDLILRYLILVLVAIPNLWLFYTIFTPLTVYPTYFLLNLVHDVSRLSESILLINLAVPIELIPACIAGSAYYLLTILNLSTPGLRLEKRIGLLLLSFVAFLILNLLRIFVLSLLAVSGASIFSTAHQLSWYLLSIVFVVGIWFSEVRIFRIKGIPLYSDLKSILSGVKR